MFVTNCISTTKIQKISEITNFFRHYFLSRTEVVLASLFEFAEITSVDSNAVKSAVTLQAKDFEDALQYFSAKAIGVDCIVTRNVKDFPFSELQVLTPKDFLAHYAVK